MAASSIFEESELGIEPKLGRNKHTYPLAARKAAQICSFSAPGSAVFLYAFSSSGLRQLGRAFVFRALPVSSITQPVRVNSRYRQL